MRTAKQIIENIEDRLSHIKEQQKRTYGMNETYSYELEGIASELDDLLNWIKE
jgi:ABC-type Zn uptake system ZnuABC Zn-binding protein ZnuA